MSLNVGVIGGGALGTALSQVVSENVDEVILYVRRDEVCDTINKTHYNSSYYPNVLLNENITSTTDLYDLKKSSIIFLTIPSSAFRDMLLKLSEVIDKDTILVTTAKGMEYPSLKTMGDIISEFFSTEYVALSGPNFASEIVLNQPTITNIASRNKANAIKVRDVLTTKEFKVKIIDDVKGLELCGILKNVVAIVNGICEGMKINENAKYSILTKAFNDSIKIIQLFGGKSETAFEYCGFGDLILTSTSSESRNHSLGILYGQRLIIDEAKSGIVFEGKKSIKSIKNICDMNGINSDVVNFAYNVVVEKMIPVRAFSILWDKLER